VAGGGIGEVYAAAQDGLDRVVARKVIRAGSAGPLARDRVDRERLVLARLHQSNVVPVYYAGGEGDLQFYAMQFVAGVPLNRVVTVVAQGTTTAPTGQTPPLPAVVDSILKDEPQPPAAPAPAAAVRLSAGYFRSVAAALAQAADAVHHGREKHVLHRDVMPSNLILDARGVCMVIDYGLARSAGAAPAVADDPVEDALTRGGVGTPQYMAPE
jgi:serine/threonine protein kinase